MPILGSVFLDKTVVLWCHMVEGANGTSKACGAGEQEAEIETMSREEYAGPIRDAERDEVARLFDRHATELSLFAASICGDRSLADDAVQQAFASFIRRGTFRVQNARRYLYRAVRNAALNLVRTANREARKRRALTGDFPACFSEPAERSAELQALNNAMVELSPEQREVVTLKVWGKLTFVEIGELLGLSANTAASRYRYGLARLREAMRVYYDERE